MRLKVLLGTMAAGLLFLVVYGSLPPKVQASPANAAAAVPAFTHGKPEDWLNSKPLSWADLRGDVVLLDFWTFECWNCYRSIPWLKSLESRYGSKGLRIVGVHTPEFERERARDSVEKKLVEFGIGHPVMLDNDYSYWNALNNQYWPAFYLVDRRGQLRSMFAGETHEGDANAKRIETAITELLSEAAQ